MSLINETETRCALIECSPGVGRIAENQLIPIGTTPMISSFESSENFIYLLPAVHKFCNTPSQ